MRRKVWCQAIAVCKEDRQISFVFAQKHTLKRGSEISASSSGDRLDRPVAVHSVDLAVALGNHDRVVAGH